MGDDAPVSMMVKDPDEGALKSLKVFVIIRAGHLGYSDITLAWSKTFGCSGYHSLGGGYLPRPTKRTKKSWLTGMQISMCITTTLKVLKLKKLSCLFFETEEKSHDASCEA